MTKQERYVYGLHAVREALSAGKEIDKVLVKRGPGSDSLNRLISGIREKGIPVQHVPPERLNRVTGKNHQGVIAFLSGIEYADITLILPSIFETGEDPLILILDGITDVRNFGAVARSAECAGVHAILVPATGSAAANADAIKASAGALHRIPVCRHNDLVKATRYLKDSGLRLFAATEKATEPVFRADLRGPAGIILGSEGSGIGQEVAREADRMVTIPMKGKIGSLNVSVAAGIILFEVLRQRTG